MLTQLNQWLDRHGIRPRVVAEFDDSALLKVFGADGIGVFPAPEAVAEELRVRYGAAYLGNADGVVECFYAISAERRIKHPAVVALSQAAQHEVFAAGTRPAAGRGRWPAAMAARRPRRGQGWPRVRSNRAASSKRPPSEPVTPPLYLDQAQARRERRARIARPSAPRGSDRRGGCDDALDLHDHPA